MFYCRTMELKLPRAKFLRIFEDEEGEPIYVTKNGEGDLVVMSIEAFEQRGETLKLRGKLEAAEQARLSGTPVYTLEESRKRLGEIYRRG